MQPANRIPYNGAKQQNQAASVEENPHPEENETKQITQKQVTLVAV